MKELGLEVKRKKRLVLTTDSNHSEPVSKNLLNRDFNRNQQNQVWTTNITYVWTRKDRVSLAVVIDLFSRRVFGWHADESMKTALVSKALMMAMTLRAPSPGLLHHSDKCSQYASKQYKKLLQDYGFIYSRVRKIIAGTTPPRNVSLAA